MAVYNRVSEQSLDEEQHQQAGGGEARNSRQRPGSGRRSEHENVGTVESLLLSRLPVPYVPGSADHFRFPISLHT